VTSSGSLMPDRARGALSRRELIAGGSVVGALTLAGAGTYAAGAFAGPRAGAFNRYGAVPTSPTPIFRSRPDLRIPGLAVRVDTGTTAPGVIFLAPFGPLKGQEGALIVDGAGRPIWEHPLNGLETDNFRVQTYKGRTVLTWWEGVLQNGHGVGSYVIANTDYEPIARVHAGHGLQGDLHEFLLTSDGTALLTTYVITERDLRSVGGSEQGKIQDAIFQEVDVANGRVLLEWRSLDHIPLAESQWPLSHAWDYVHLNSVDVDVSDGNLLVSSRNTQTIYKVHRTTGEIIWRLGGRRSDFKLGPGVRFAWQHDARSHPGGVITLFDNEGAPFAGSAESRGLALNVDEAGMRATVKQEYLHPLHLRASSEGSVQVLPNGNVFVSWGAEPFVSEYTADGHLLFDARLGTDYVGYRGFRLPWSAVGEGVPRIAAGRDGAHATTVWVSWNGDTQVTDWVCYAGGATGSLQRAAQATRSGFETAIRVSGAPARVAVHGLDASGKTLGTSATLTV
jgi:Arylsulfotransferase (ASST)